MTDLTCLTIVYEHSFHIETEDHDGEILALLKDNPNIEKLVLEDVMSSGDGGRLFGPWAHVTEPVELAQLKDLSLVDNINRLAPLLPLLKVPSAEKVVIGADLARHYNEEYLEGFSAALQRFLMLNQWTTKFTRVLISISKPMTVEFFSGWPPCDTLSVNVSRIAESEIQHWTNILAMRLPMMLANLKAAYIWRRSKAPNVHISPLYNALSRIPTLTHLDVRDSTSSPQILVELLPILEPRGPDTPGDVNQTFRVLKTLRIVKLEMFKKTSESQKESVFQQLVSVMNRRKEAGVNVPKLVLKECTFVEPLDVVISTENAEFIQPRTGPIEL
ncbi:hypothetical protein BDY19DRAFT_454374 [Irpex rosettiformis]|uniref:Uncharacterized protein n=1 Tax=Irpex rosettiformis TaxID=378272 RepID=A0ACB8TT66_9APHY|nr:hypothetical protein BDY19DRAFT_454374 [Irpex rosettiformis]